MSPLVAVTDHAAERFRQRVGGRAGDIDPRSEIVTRVVRAWDAGRVTDEPRAAVATVPGPSSSS